MDLNIIENDLVNTTFILLFITFIAEWMNLIIINNSSLSKIIQTLNIGINILLATILTTRWISNGYFPLRKRGNMSL